MAAKNAPSAVEALKAASRQLRGRIAEDLPNPAPFDEDAYNLLKHHGTYQGYDRDTATARKQRGLPKEYSFMIRARVPGGRLTAEQYLALDALADRYANGTLRITTRQTIQFHGVIKQDLKSTIAGMNQALVTTLGACGDVVRNVTTVPAPIKDAVHARLEADARQLSAALLPTTRAYHEIWLDGEPLEAEPEDPLYGATYLPRKFKIGIAVPEDNSIDVLTNDLGIIALFDGDRLTGYNLALGGGLGMTHNNPKTYPRLASIIASIGPDELIEAATAVVKLQRDHGDRSNRRHARLKYLVAEQGAEWIRAELARYLGRPVAPARPMPRFQVVDHLGWHEQGDGLFYLGIPVPSGRVRDTEGCRLRTALREAIRTWQPTPVLTPSQDILLGDIRPEHRAAIEAELRRHGVVLVQDVAPVRRWSLACPALPTCGLALTEAERIQAPLLDDIEAALSRHGLGRERLSIRITGCPNGCARPYAGDIGLVGRMPGHFALYLGGDFEGTRLNFKFLDKVPQGEVAAVLDPLFGWFRADRRAGEGFGDFCHRVGSDALLARLGRQAA